MHESEKSDSVVVAGKPTNKTARAVAEPVEPRTGTQGNADQQSTHRAQDRESVSQALERVRQAARQRKKERFSTGESDANLTSSIRDIAATPTAGRFAHLPRLHE